MSKDQPLSSLSQMHLCWYCAIISSPVKGQFPSMGSHGKEKKCLGHDWLRASDRLRGNFQSYCCVWLVLARKLKSILGWSRAAVFRLRFFEHRWVFLLTDDQTFGKKRIVGSVMSFSSKPVPFLKYCHW